MQKSLTLFLFGFGLVLVSTGAAYAKADIFQVHFGPTPLLFNVNPGWSLPTGQSDHAAGGAYPLAPVSPPVQDNYATITRNMSSAALAGALTLLLIQRKRRGENVLRPGS